MRRHLADDLVAAVNAPGVDLAAAALVIARLEYPRLDAASYLTKLDAMGDAADHHITAVGQFVRRAELGELRHQPALMTLQEIADVTLGNA